VKGINNRQKMIVKPRENADRRLMTMEKVRRDLNRKKRVSGAKARYPGWTSNHERP